MGKDRDGPGPSAEFARRHPERVYGGPSPIEFKQRALNMGAAETEAYYGKLPEAHQPPLPRLSRFLGIGGWVFGGIACAYMVLYADFGDHEHVFSPARRAFHKYTNEMFTLSQKERTLLGLDKETMMAVRPAEEKKPS